MQFLDGKEASYILSSWPRNHLVKVLCYVPENAAEPDLSQVHALQNLYEATKQTGHHLLIELVYLGKRDDMIPIAQMVEACYAAKIYPFWWKLPPITDTSSWERIEKQIETHDPYMPGVLLLGANLPLKTLGPTLNSASLCSSKVRGFAVGRSLWDQEAEKWFQGQIDDNDVVQSIATNYQKLIDYWSQRKEMSHDSNTQQQKRVDTTLSTNM